MIRSQRIICQLKRGDFSFVAQNSLTHFALFLKGGGVQYEAQEQAAL
jgi:hypothetical protein